MSESIWEILGIEPVKDKKQIKRAYAAALKTCHPEEHPEEFKRLHDAYERAMRYAQSGIWQEPCPEGEEAPAREDSAEKEEKVQTPESEEEPDEKKKSAEQEKIGRYFTMRENAKTIYRSIFYDKMEWYRCHVLEQDAWEEMALYFSGGSFGCVKEEPDVLKLLSFALGDAHFRFTDSMKDALWAQYGFTYEEEFERGDPHLGIYNVLRRDQKRRQIEAENRQFQLVYDEYEKLAEKERKRNRMLFLIGGAIALAVMLVNFAMKTVTRHQEKEEIQKEYEEHSEDFLELMCDRYPDMRFDGFEVQGSSGAYQLQATAYDAFGSSFPVSIDVRVEEDGSLSLLADDLKEQMLDRVMEDYQVKLALGSGVEYLDSENAAEDILVAYYNPNEEGNLETICGFIAEYDFVGHMPWLSDVIFCYEGAENPECFFAGGEGGIPEVVRYGTGSIPDKGTLMDEVYEQGLFYYMHYIPWRMNQELISEFTQAYNEEAAKFDGQQSMLSDGANLPDAEIEECMELIEWADSRGVKLLAYWREEERLCITQGDWYRLLLAVGVEVERNGAHTGFSIQVGDRTAVYGEITGDDWITCPAALEYLERLGKR